MDTLVNEIQQKTLVAASIQLFWVFLELIFHVIIHYLGLTAFSVSGIGIPIRDFFLHDLHEAVLTSKSKTCSKRYSSALPKKLEADPKVGCWVGGWVFPVPEIWIGSPVMNVSVFLSVFGYQNHGVFGIKVMNLYLYRWWFQISFNFTAIPGEMIQFDEHFSNGLKPPTRYIILLFFSVFLPLWITVMQIRNVEEIHRFKPTLKHCEQRYLPKASVQKIAEKPCRKFLEPYDARP